MFDLFDKKDQRNKSNTLNRLYIRRLLTFKPIILNIIVLFYYSPLKKTPKKVIKKMVTKLNVEVDPELYDRAKKSNIVVKRVVKSLLEDYLRSLEKFNANYTNHVDD